MKNTTTRRAVVKGAAIGSAVAATAAVATTATAGSANAATYYNMTMPYPQVGGGCNYYVGMKYVNNYAHASVMNIQRRMGVAQDDWYGTQTRAAVLNFQRSRGLVTDGVFGPATCHAAGMTWLANECVYAGSQPAHDGWAPSLITREGAHPSVCSLRAAQVFIERGATDPELMRERGFALGAVFDEAAEVVGSDL